MAPGDAPNPKKPNSLARNFGRFFGHVKRGFTEPVEDQPDQTEPEKRTVEVARHEQTASVETEQGEVTLRRTTIDEVELPPGVKPDERSGR